MSSSMRGATVLAALAVATACGNKKTREEAPAPAVVYDAAPAPTVRQRPEKSARYSKALHRGRALGDAGDFAGAMAAFGEALAALPGDARALSELGWVAFKRGDLDAAERATDASIAAADGAREPKLRAASLYNRGRIAEQRGDTAAAMESYRASLALRPHDVVEARLARLGGPAVETLAPQPMSGPFATIAEACKTFPFHQPDWTCAAPRVDGPIELPAPRSPYLEARLIGESAPAADQVESYDTCRLAIRVAAGWFVSDGVSCEASKWGRSAVRALEWQAGGAVILWRHEYAAGDRGTDRDGKRYRTFVTTEVVRYCGVGSSGVPSCTPRIPVRVSEEGDFAYSDVVPYELAATLGDDGVLSISARSAQLDRDAQALLGSRALAFP